MPLILTAIIILLLLLLYILSIYKFISHIFIDPCFQIGEIFDSKYLSLFRQKMSQLEVFFQKRWRCYITFYGFNEQNSI